MRWMRHATYMGYMRNSYKIFDQKRSLKVLYNKERDYANLEWLRVGTRCGLL